MAITTLEARRQILDDLATAIDQLALSLACLGEAHELLDDDSAERLEAELFRPVQRAYGRGKRTYTGFASRVGLEARDIDSPSGGVSADGVREYVTRAVGAAGDADRKIAELQDSMLPIESGDAELRAGLSETRELLDGLPAAAVGFLRTLGR
jgi:hypothetical protein